MVDWPLKNAILQSYCKQMPTFEESKFAKLNLPESRYYSLKVTLNGLDSQNEVPIKILDHLKFTKGKVPLKCNLFTTASIILTCIYINLI